MTMEMDNWGEGGRCDTTVERTEKAFEMTACAWREAVFLL